MSHLPPRISCRLGLGLPHTLALRHSLALGLAFALGLAPNGCEAAASAEVRSAIPRARIRSEGQRAAPEATPTFPAQGLTEPTVALVTVGPGPELFHRYGHAALCLFFYQRRRRSRCFNYGVTDFESPPQTIGWRFVRGTAKFWVDVDTWSVIRALYTRQDRDIFVQQIPLRQPQVDALVQRLERDLLPGNRSYRYHHFDDNCATRLRDHLDAVTGGRLRAAGRRGSGTTLRTLGRQGIADRPLLVALSYLTLGRRLDREATVWETLFLPARLRAEVARVLHAPAIRVYRRRGPAVAPPRGSAAVWLIGLGLLLALPLALSRRLSRGERLAGAVAGIGLGLLGLVIWILVAITQVREMRVNEVLLLLWPGDLILPWLSPARRHRYLRLRLAGIALVLLFRLIGVLRQPLYAVAAIPALPLSAWLWPLSGRAGRTQVSKS